MCCTSQSATLSNGGLIDCQVHNNNNNNKLSGLLQVANNRSQWAVVDRSHV